MTPEEAKDMHALAIGAAPVASAGNALSERGAFERWIASAMRDLAQFKRNFDDYQCVGTQIAWKTWQARAALASQSTPVAPVVEQAREVTDAMVTAYLDANDAYWKRMDSLPAIRTKWRNGTPREATREGLIAALAQSTPHVPAGEPTLRTHHRSGAPLLIRSPKRETQGVDSVGDDVPCSKCGAALDTGLECTECGHDMAPALATPRAPEPAAPVAQEPVTWRCFHCDEAFTDPEAARLHFGDSEYQSPICTIDPAHFRWMEAQHRRNVDDDSEALRTIRTIVGEHETLRRRAEESGYAKGLEDAKKHPADLGLQPVAAPTAAQGLSDALDALEEIALAGMSGSGQESEEGMRDWHARRAWEFIGIAARARDAILSANRAAQETK